MNPELNETVSMESSADLQMAIIGLVIIAAVYVDVLRQRTAKK
ncbi:hypothetical protein OH784_18065 [Ectobacillus funiculus]